MRVAELSRRTGVSVASIKYYLREGLLAPGERTGPNQAVYGEDHVRRLRLVRALIDVGGLTVAGSREVLAAVDDDAVGLHRALGVTQCAVTPVPGTSADEATERATKLVDDLVARRGWWIYPDNPGRRAAIEILATCDRLDSPGLPSGLDAYADAMETLAEHEVATIAGHAERERTVESAVVGMVLGASLVTAVRTMAQEAASARRLGPAGGPATGGGGR